MRAIVGIAKNSSTPVFYQIQEQIKQQIKSGALQHGDPVPSERELSHHLGVSRTTVRKAIRNLVSEGYCTKQVGRGIFVASGRLTMDIQGLQGFTKFARTVGKTPGTNIIDQRVVIVSLEQAAKLQVSPESKALSLKRLRLLDELPIVLESALVSMERFPGLEQHDFHGSLYEILEREYGAKVSYSRGRISVSMVASEDAHILDLPVSSTMMTKTAVAYTEGNIPLEMITSVYRSDRIEFSYESVFRA